jgi:hypothetical protein
MPEKLYDDKGRSIVTLKGAVDWLDVTTFSADVFDEWTKYLYEIHISQPRQMKLQRYTGVIWNDTVFIGSGTQKKMPHFMLHVTGVDADRIFREFASRKCWETDRVKCTRIDIQTTFWGDPNRMSLVAIAQEERETQEYEIKNKRKHVIEAILGDENDTLYVGAKSSQRRLRIYDKMLVDEYGKTHFMERTELQFRKQTADGVFKRLEAVDDRNMSEWIESAIRGETSKFPDHIRDQLTGWTGTQERDSVAIPRGKKIIPVSNRARWVIGIRKALTLACKEEGESGRRARSVLFNAIVSAFIGTRWDDQYHWKIIRYHDDIDAVEFYRYDMSMAEGEREPASTENSDHV